MNRLSSELSPYLLQHKNNPVHWYSWCSEAFERAKNENKPIFLSIGYSTCHWCHVMAHETFEDEEAARMLNEHFIAIKVDKEERPDIDAVYMAACIAMTGSGGWPLSAMLAPDGKPFWCGTYLPKDAFIGLMEEVSGLWINSRESLDAFAERLTAHLNGGKTTLSTPDINLIRRAVTQLASQFDGINGGFGGAPKFPMPHNIIFLMKHHAAFGDKNALKMAEKTLIQMYRGGIFDHIGGGFARYSTDVRWLAPHFEKMLYDNALLICAYAEGYRHTGREVYKTACERTIGYAFRQLMDENGGFFCGQDADSEGEEGRFYLFTKSELKNVLTDDEADTFCSHYGITERGNFEDKNIPSLLCNEDWENEPENMAEIREKLLKYRENRAFLHRDEKILTSWNGLMMAALARAGAVFKNPDCTAAAVGIYDFIMHNMLRENRFYPAFVGGKAYGEGRQDDYAFVLWGILELYNVTFDAKYLEQALKLTEIFIDGFFDKNDGGIYPYAHDGEQLIARIKDSYDGAIPSANSVSGLVFSRLARLTGRADLTKTCNLQLEYLSGASLEAPMGYTFAMLALLEHLHEPKELVCAASELNDEIKAQLIKLSDKNIAILVETPQNAEKLSEIAPFTADYPIPESGALYYLCKNHACSAPVRSIDELNI